MILQTATIYCVCQMYNVCDFVVINDIARMLAFTRLQYDISCWRFKVHGLITINITTHELANIKRLLCTVCVIQSYSLVYVCYSHQLRKCFQYFRNKQTLWAHQILHLRRSLIYQLFCTTLTYLSIILTNCLINYTLSTPPWLISKRISYWYNTNRSNKRKHIYYYAIIHFITIVWRLYQHTAIYKNSISPPGGGNSAIY